MKKIEKTPVGVRDQKSESGDAGREWTRRERFCKPLPEPSSATAPVVSISLIAYREALGVRRYVRYSEW